MRIKILLILGCSFVFSCQNQEGDNRLYWVEEIDKAITKYDKSAKIEFESDSSFIIKQAKPTTKGYTNLKIYQKDMNGNHKVELHDSVYGFFDFSEEFYLKHNRIILHRTYGAFPLLYKSKRGDSDPCCQLYERINYYSKDSLQKEFMKKMDVMEFQDLEIKEKEFQDLKYDEVDEDSSRFYYSSSKKRFNEIKEQFANSWPK